MSHVAPNVGATGMQRSTIARSVKFLGVGARQVRVIASDATPDRMGDVLVPSGVQLANYRKNPVVLAQHDVASPIARCATIGVESGQVVALIEFPPEGVNAKSDEYLRLMKAGVVSAVSVGFIPLAWEPIRGAGLKFTSWEMIELSAVSVPANPAALVTERGFGDPGVAQRVARAQELHRSLSRPMRHPGAGESTEAEMLATAKRLALRHLRDSADMDSAAGRAAHARRLRSFYAKDGGVPVVDQRAAVAEARWRTAPRW